MFTFAELLRSFRTRASLDQTTLAVAVGIHINTLGTWERGLYLPRRREMVLRLAQELTLSPPETDQFLQAANFSVEYGTPEPTFPGPQLPPPVADFVGRLHEIDALVTGLQHALAQGAGALLSGIHGMGGIGKTELAHVVAHRLRDAFPDGQLIVHLRGASATPLTAEQALQGIVRSFARQEKLPDDLPALQQFYHSVLNRKRVLILADDAHDAAQVRPLRPPSGCALLITSRQRFTLPGMPALHLDPLSEAEAVELLRRIHGGLDLAEAQAIAWTCGGLPLALRVSGSILRNDPALPAADYVARLTDERQRLAQLCDPDDSGLDVAASLRLSYAQLDAPVRRLFQQLGVLAGDFAAAMAQAVTEAPGLSVDETLRLLLRRNLIVYEPTRARWRLHDLVRVFALSELEAAGELEAACWRYGRYMARVAWEIQEQYRRGEALAALARFDLERAHVDGVRRWAMAHAGTPEGDQLLVEEAIATRYVARVRYHAQRERIPQLEAALAAAQRLGSRDGEGQLLNLLGIAYDELGKARQAVPYYEQRLAIAREIGDRHSEGTTLNNLGVAYRALGDARRAILYYEQRLAIAREVGDQRGAATVLGNLGEAYALLGHRAQAMAAFEQSLTGLRQIGDRRRESVTLGDLGLAYIAQGDAQQALQASTLSLDIAREIGDRRSEGYALSCQAQSFALLGDTLQAIRAFEQALVIFREVGDRSGEADCQWHFGLTVHRHGECERALSLLRASVAFQQEIDHVQAAEHAAFLTCLEAEVAGRG